MSTLTVAFDPDVDTHADVTAMIDRVYGLAADAVTMSEEPAESGDSVSFNGTTWTPAKMSRYVANLTEGGQQALRAMIGLGQHSNIEDVQQQVGMAPAKYAGTMSTFGHAVNNTRGVYGKPFIRNGDTYFLPANVAALADDALRTVGV